MEQYARNPPPVSHAQQFGHGDARSGSTHPSESEGPCGEADPPPQRPHGPVHALGHNAICTVASGSGRRKLSPAASGPIPITFISIPGRTRLWQEMSMARFVARFPSARMLAARLVYVYPAWCPTAQRPCNTCQTTCHWLETHPQEHVVPFPRRFRMKSGLRRNSSGGVDRPTAFV